MSYYKLKLKLNTQSSFPPIETILVEQIPDAIEGIPQFRPYGRPDLSFCLFPTQIESVKPMTEEDIKELSKPKEMKPKPLETLKL